jgi:putative component of membrane protein insertase Oxa1/YidC/SpoIIIJ protein YidD
LIRGARALVAAAALLVANGCRSAIGLWQEELGAQWGFHCDFQPSCSEYGRQSVEEYGAVPGSLMIADRLMRDHDLERADYATDELGRPLDPPRANALFGPREDDGSVDMGLVLRDEQESERAPLGDEEGQRRFADELFAARDLERARVEYLRLLRWFPATSHVTSCRERIALCHAAAGRRAAALAEAERIADPAERERTRALVLRELGRPAEALRAAESGEQAGALLTGMLALEAQRGEVARARFETLEAEELRAGLLDRVDAFDELPRKSRWLAGSMSAVLPGSGQLYAGRPGDAAVAFLVNAVLIGGTIAAARHDEDAAAVAIGFVAFGFYAGNVYGAVNAAARHDREQTGDFVARTRGWVRQSGSLRVWLGVAPDGDGGALGIYFGF